MAISTNSPEKTTTIQQPAPDNPNPPNSDLPDSSAAPPSAIPAKAAVAAVNPNPTLNISQPTPSQPAGIAPPPQIQPFVPPSLVSTVPPSFRPAAPPVPLPSAPQFSPIPNPNFQNHGIQGQGQGQVQPPGVMMPPPSQSSGAMSSIPQMMQPQYGQPGQQPMRMYAPMPNGYQMAVPQGTMNPPGILRYAPPPYPNMIRPGFPQRALGPMGVIPALPRPPMMAMRGPVIPTIIRPPVNLAIAPAEKPMTTVYVGKIASTVDNDFMLSLLQLCGPVKSWKRVPDPTTGALKGFGFCEFESVEGVLRALRLLSKLSIDGQELLLNCDKDTKEYLKRYVAKKKENLKNQKATESEGNASGVEKNEPSKPSMEEAKKEDDNNTSEANKESDDNTTFGLVTDEDKEADREANEKLTGMIEERIKNKPLPPPPPPPLIAPDAAGISTSEHPARSRDADSDVDMTKNAEDRNDEEMTSKSKPLSETERPETSSPDRNNRRSKDRDRDLKREKERELERYEREREQERAKREREREYKIREEERRYRARLKEWESREKDKERARKQEREREKDREQDRKYEILDQENDEGYNSKKRKYRGSGEEREERKRRVREKEEDLDDRIREEEEIAEAKRKAEEEREMQKEQQKHALELLSANTNNVNNGSEHAMVIDGSLLEIRNKAGDQINDVEMTHENEIGSNRVAQNGTNDDSNTATSETRQSNTVTTKKLGFGLVGSGKRTTVPSLFHEEEEEDAQKDKKMRPLVPIDYSTEELQAVQDTTTPLTPTTNLAAAAEFAKRIGNVNARDERSDSERERSKRSHESRKEQDRGVEKAKTPDNKKLLDAKQLIDTIPKTKDELFSYPINWATYDKNGLHERMRPWISKKITDFLGEEETTLVDYIVSSTQEHVTADEMLERLQSILDDEAEMFVLKMWRMLIFEIKKVETGLTGRAKA